MRVRATNPTPQGLFEAIASQLIGQIIKPDQVGEALREKVSAEGEGLEHLLEEWVAALLDLVRIQHMVFREFRVTELKMGEKGPYSVRAEAVGELLDPHRHSLNPSTPRLACREAHLIKDAAGYHAEIDLAE
jgi:SHS2 domain-containing protein